MSAAASLPPASDAERASRPEDDRPPIARFVAARRARWERLDALTVRASRVRPRHTPPTVEELSELVSLYRRATADLALAQRDFPGDRVTLALNQLVGRGHAILYREPPAPLRRLRQYVGRDLPRAYRAAGPYLLAAALLFFLPLLATMATVLIAPDAAARILPPGMLDDIRAGRTWFASPVLARPAMASLIMTNNAKVAFLAFGGGLLAGVGTAFVLVFNGVQIGAVFGALLAYGLWQDLLDFVSPHGFLELSVVVVAGACGLMLGKAIVWPGLAPRGEALTAAAGRAVALLLGLLPVLGVAGLLEGFVSPAAFAWPAKLAIGLVTAVALYAYLLLAGRDAGLPARRSRYRSARSLSSR